MGVTVLMDKAAARLVSTNTRFWVVRARVSMAAVSGLGTVFSGAVSRSTRLTRQFEERLHRP